MSELIFLSHTGLKIHPKNMRIYYPPADVAEMARSLQAVGKVQPAGNIDALPVVPVEGEPGAYYVVNGNLRLTAGRTLGSECPPFKCEVIEASEAEQLLLMAVTGLHYPKDPISEARHYRRLVEEEGMPVWAIARETGLSPSTIGNRLALLDLDEAIQLLIIEKRLPADVRLVRALRQIPDPAQRINIASYYARHDVAIGSMVKRIRALIERTHHASGNGATYHEKQAKVLAVAQVRVQARAANRAGLDDESAQTIWRLAGEFLCEGCKLNGLGVECYLCPGPQEFIEHLVELAEARQPLEGPEAAEPRRV